MPYNQLLLPLIGGYILVNFTHITSYWASRQSREHFLLAAALAGLISLIIARTTIVLLLETPLRPYLHQIYEAVHSSAPYDGIGTALAAFFLCLLLRFWINCVWSREDAAIWLYANNVYNQLERLFHYTYLRVDEVQTRPFVSELLWRMFLTPPKAFKRWVVKIFQKLRTPPQPPEPAEPTEPTEHSPGNPEAGSIVQPGTKPSGEGDGKKKEPISVMLSMKDRKVYVGWILWVPPLRAESSSYIKIYPAWSGYRDSETLKVHVSERYDSEKFVNPEIPKGKLIAVSDIANVSLYDIETFQGFNSVEPGQKRRPGLLRRLWDALLG